MFREILSSPEAVLILTSLIFPLIFPVNTHSRTATLYLPTSHNVSWCSMPAMCGATTFRPISGAFSPLGHAALEPRRKGQTGHTPGPRGPLPRRDTDTPTIKQRTRVWCGRYQYTEEVACKPQEAFHSASVHLLCVPICEPKSLLCLLAHEGGKTEAEIHGMK